MYTCVLVSKYGMHTCVLVSKYGMNACCVCHVHEFVPTSNVCLNLF